MLASPPARVAGVLLFLGLLFGLSIWFGSLPPSPSTGDFPANTDLIRNYDQHVGDRVTVGGKIVDGDPVVIELSNGVETRRLTIRNPPSDATLGDDLSVHGVAKQDYTIRAINAYTVPKWGHWYTYTISFVAGLWTLTRLIRHWHISTEEYGLVPRPTPPPIQEWLFDRFSPTTEEVDTDA